MFKNAADSQSRADKFVLDILENDQIYYLLQPSGGIYACESHDGEEKENHALVLPFWSKRYLPYAKKYGEGLTISQMSLDEFFNQLLPSMIKDNIFVGLNWDHLGFGREIEPSLLYKQIHEKMNGA